MSRYYLACDGRFLPLIKFYIFTRDIVSIVQIVNKVSFIYDQGKMVKN